MKTGLINLFAGSILCLLMTSCATSPQSNSLKGSWYKKDSSRDEFNRDRGQCMVHARATNRTALLFDPIIFAGCMQGKGWTWVSE